ncbi:hypothetical protein VTI74DRAFT_2935 [Chaetomium olivicolor]
MESKFFSSSPAAGPTKRGLDQALRDSPTAKRAKRAKDGKKRRSKGKKDKESDGYVEQHDWVTFDVSPAASSPIPRKPTFVHPPTPFPLKLALQAMKSVKKEKEAKSETEADAADANNLANECKTALTNPKTQANTRKARAEPDTKKGPKDANKNYNFNEAPAIAGPSKPFTNNQAAAELPRDLTPLSDFTPPIDFTFKAFPNPPVVPPTSSSSTGKTGENTPINAINPLDTMNTAITNNNGKITTITTSDNNLGLETNPTPLKTPAGTKTLKAIKKRLKAFESTLTSYPSEFSNQLQSLHSNIVQLHERLERNELRAAVRHEMLFNSLVKVAGDVGRLSHEVASLQSQIQHCHHIHDDRKQGQEAHDQCGSDTMGADGEIAAAATATASMVKDTKETKETREKQQRLSASMLQSRKTLEQCLRIYTEDMNRAGTREEVGKFGGLCVQYAGDLFKTLS